MRSKIFAYPILVSTSFLFSCVGSGIGPDCFERDAGGKCIIPEYEPPPPDLSLDCGMPGIGAVGANFDHYVDFTGPNSVVFSAEGLPEGLQIGATTGQIYGAPTTAGSYGEVVITMTDTDSGAALDDTCPEIVINEAFSTDVFDKPASAPYGCIPVGESLEDHIMGGTGGEWTCSVDGPENEREGEGIIPAGVTFDSETCTASGTPSDDFVGTWVWMVEVKQSSYSIFVPFCATKDDATFHDVNINIDGQDVDPLAPMLLPFQADQELRFGDGDTHRFEVTEACANNSCLNWAYQHRMYWSPFDAWTTKPATTIKDMNGNLNIGFSHHLAANTDGNTVEEQGFGSRAWVADWRMWYCTSSNLGTCDPDNEDSVLNNAQTKIVWAVIAYPG